MYYIGSIINLVFGIGKTAVLNKKLKDIEKMVEEYKANLDKYTEELDAFEKFMAKDNLLLAEYFFKKQECIKSGDAERLKKLWEGVKVQMENNLAQVERQLESQYATKLDIARLISGLRQIGGELEKELFFLKEELRREVNGNIEKYVKDVEELKGKVENYFDFMKSFRKQVEENLIFGDGEGFGKADFDFKAKQEDLEFEVLSVRREFKDDLEKIEEKFNLMLAQIDREIAKVKERINVTEKSLKDSNREMEQSIERLKVEFEGRLLGLTGDLKSAVDNLNILNRKIGDMKEKVISWDKKLIDAIVRVREDCKSDIENLKREIDAKFYGFKEEINRSVKILNYEILLGLVACLVLTYLFFV